MQRLYEKRHLSSFVGSAGSINHPELFKEGTISTAAESHDISINNSLMQGELSQHSERDDLTEYCAAYLKSCEILSRRLWALKTNRLLWRVVGIVGILIVSMDMVQRVREPDAPRSEALRCSIDLFDASILTVILEILNRPFSGLLKENDSPELAGVLKLTTSVVKVLFCLRSLIDIVNLSRGIEVSGADWAKPLDRTCLAVSELIPLILQWKAEFLSNGSR